MNNTSITAHHWKYSWGNSYDHNWSCSLPWL